MGLNQNKETPTWKITDHQKQGIILIYIYAYEFNLAAIAAV